MGRTTYMASGRMRRHRARRGCPLRLESLEGRQLLAAPSIEAVAPVSVPAGKSVFVPIRGADADGDALRFTATSSSDKVQVQVRSGHPFLRLTVAGHGDLVFQLFDDLAPTTVERITSLVNANFYDNLTFHRIVPNFVIQGGDPSGDGSGGPGFSFADEFNPAAIFSGSGQLAMANSGKDTNGSQFFVTIGAQRFLDFNHTIFGQLVRGADVVNSIVSAPRGANDRPTTPIVISDAQIVANTTDSILQITAASDAPAAQITLTASDPGNATASRDISVQRVADTTNDPPILGAVADGRTAVGTPFRLSLSSIDLEGDPVEYRATIAGTSGATATVAGNVVTVTPAAGFVGIISVNVGVKQQGATSRGSSGDPFDSQVIRVEVVAPTFSTSGTSLSATAGQAISNAVLATFTATPTPAAGLLSAQVDWGDGTTTAGAVVDRPDGGFEVRGSHTYAAAGTFTARTILSGPGGATAQATSTATVQAGAVIDPPDTAPVVLDDFARHGILRDPTVLVLTFSGALDEASAENVANYVLRKPGVDGRLGTSDDPIIPIERATYDPVDLTVTLEPSRRLRWFVRNELLIRTDGETGLRDRQGRALDGDHDGEAGGESVVRFGRGFYYDLADGPAGTVARRDGEVIEGDDLDAQRTPSRTLERYREDAGLDTRAELRRKLVAGGLDHIVEELGPLLIDEATAARRATRRRS